MKREKSTFLLIAIFILLPSLTFSQEHPVGAGIASIWSNQTQEQNPIVNVIQGFGLWRDIQAAGENSFDWSKYNTAINRAASINKYIYLQINMQVPDWMQEKVAVVGYQKRADDYKGYQFWDPDYLNAHLKLIREFGSFVANHPNRKWVIGVRIQPNGYNTEIFNWILTSWATNPAHGTTNNLPVEKDKSTWISQPPGYSAANPKFAPHRSDTYPGTSESYGEYYMKTVINEYIEVFHPLSIGTGFRATSPLSTAYLDKLYNDNPLMQCIQTSATTNMLSGSDQHKKDEYNDIKKYCRQRGHLAYWEGSAGKDAPTWEQEIYWRDLMRLEAGGTYSATRMDRWDNGEGCREGMRFFSKYAGYHNLPELTPGAWIAMIDAPENNIKNFGYYISQNNMDATIIKNQITSHHKGYYAKQLNAGATVEFNIDESFAATARGGDATFNITWFSRSGDSWQFQINQGNGLENQGSTVSGSGTNTWQTVKFTIPISANSFPSTNDFAIQAIAGTPILHMVEIERENTNVSVKMLREKQDFSAAYPNPVKDILNIKLAETEYITSQIEIISLSGRVVRKIDIPASSDIYPLNVSELPKGFYIVKADNMQQKFLIQ
jgi:hypothetical protein